jgi:hypothetical protein
MTLRSTGEMNFTVSCSHLVACCIYKDICNRATGWGVVHCIHRNACATLHAFSLWIQQLGAASSATATATGVGLG